MTHFVSVPGCSHETAALLDHLHREGVVSMHGTLTGLALLSLSFLTSGQAGCRRPRPPFTRPR